MTKGSGSTAEKIGEFLESLPDELKLDARRKVWPQYIYHFGDIRNIANALKDGALSCRARVLRDGDGFVDCADKEVVAQSTWTHDFVRFYFRPRTPTQFYQEGIRPAANRRNDAHCGVPVFLLFDARTLLARKDTQITDGNFGRWEHHKGSGLKFLKKLPFELIYHDGVIYYDEPKDAIRYHRHAEVIYPDQIDFDDLKEIVCRSGAERDTLIYLLGESAREWRDKIRLERTGERIFYRQWLFVERTVLVGDRLFFHIKLPETAAQFEVSVRVVNLDSHAVLADKTTKLQPTGSRWRVKLPEVPNRVEVKCSICDTLAYWNVVERTAVY